MSDEADSVVPEHPAAEVPRDTYDSIEGLNWSWLRLLKRSPRHFRERIGDESDGFQVGTVFHMAVLEPERFKREVVAAPMRRDGRTKAWQEFETEQTRKGVTEILSSSEYSNVVAMRDGVLRHPRARELLANGKPEFTLQWTIEAGDLRFDCKGRFDSVSPLAIVDLKKTQDSSPKAFGRSVRKFDYLGQVAWYSDGWFRATGERLPFFFVVAEERKPHNVQVYRVTDEQLVDGRELYLSLLARLDYCRRTNWWGGYTEADETDLELPQWNQES